MDNVTEMHSEYLTSTDVARRLGCTRGRVYQLINLGRLRVVKTPAGYLVSPEAFQIYLETYGMPRNPRRMVSVAV